jgi:hypothetical protein
VTNGEDVPVSATASGAYGSKTFAALGAGKSASASFTTRLAAIPGGTMTLTASANIGGSPVTDTVEVNASPASCG